jgi:hypothetical protein
MPARSLLPTPGSVGRDASRLRSKSPASDLPSRSSAGVTSESGDSTCAGVGRSTRQTVRPVRASIFSRYDGSSVFIP